MIGIYKITNPIGQVYVGQSVNLEMRKYGYSKMNFNTITKLIKSLKEYGWNNHVFEILIECKKEDLKDLERHYQDLYECIGENGLNMRLTKSKDKPAVICQEVLDQSQETRFRNQERMKQFRNTCK